MAYEERTRRYEWVIIPILLVAAAFLGGDYYGQKKVENSLVSERDTTTKIVTVYKDFPDPVKSSMAGVIAVPKYLFLTDTAHIEVEVPVPGDTVTQYVYLPREQKYYEEEEGRLRMWVSGYEPRLDRYELDAVTTTITNTVYEKPSRWGISISAGYGATLIDKNVKLSPYLGIGVSYTFLRF